MHHKEKGMGVSSVWVRVVSAVLRNGLLWYPTNNTDPPFCQDEWAKAKTVIFVAFVHGS